LAFVPPSTGSKGGAIKAACNANHLFANTPTRSNSNFFGAACTSSTKLWGSSDDDDDDDGQQTPKPINKGTTAKKATKQTAKAAASSKSKPTNKKNGSTTKKNENQKPIEISTQSLSPSQKEANNVEEEDREPDELDQNYSSPIPQTGYSLADQLENTSPANKERFETTLTPIVVGIYDSDGGKEEEKVTFEYDEDGFPTGVQEAAVDEEANDGPRHQGVARIDTISTLGNVGEEPVRWLVSLGDTINNEDNGDADQESYAMVDLPPYSDKLADEIRTFMDREHTNATDVATKSKAKASMDVILLTNQQCIHYDSTPAVYVTRKSDLKKWKKAFPTAEVIMYRLDIPRECRDEVTQVLDGYGPWGWDESDAGDHSDKIREDEHCGKKQFIETGRPLIIEEWDDDTKSKVFSQGEMPPDDQVVENDDARTNNDGDDSLYSPEAIRQREDKHRLLAVYTPGHTFGSVTYIFPNRGICCSGYGIPLESSGNTASQDDYYDDFDESQVSTSGAVPPQGPRLDYQGYLATSASRPRQMSSALSLINNYIDRFRVVLPARGDVVFLDSEEEARKREIMESVGLYKKIGDIYGRLGIVE